MMKKTICIGIAAALVMAVAGCRRTDFREVTIDVPGMTETNQQAICEALFFYDGVVRDSLKFDMAKKQLTLRFDSLKVAQTNLRMAIEQRGIAVKYPPNTTGVAGYINRREPEVPERGEASGRAKSKAAGGASRSP